MFLKGRDITKPDVSPTAAPDRSEVSFSDHSTTPSGVRLPDLAGRAARVRGDAERAIALAGLVGTCAALPGNGNTAGRWELLATLAAADLTAARVAEAHLDALAIIAEAGLDGHTDLAEIGAGPDSTWGVFAAEGPGLKVQADRIQIHGEGRWNLVGTKPWCSLAGRLSHALITAHTAGGHRRLFAVSLQTPEIRCTDQPWVSRGLREVVSSSIELRGTVALPIGVDDWYLHRDGFAWGGAGVAACWYGGAVGLARTLHARVSAREPDQISLMHLGAIDLGLSAARCLLASAALAIDQGRADGTVGVLMANRVRGVVARAAEDALLRLGHALGPAPLAQDEEHARRVADLEIYLRQHHAERDEAALGSELLRGEVPW